MMGFAMLLALPAMLFIGSLLDLATADDSASADDHEPAAAAGNGDLLDDETAVA
jgi:hypothetical protein